MDITCVPVTVTSCNVMSHTALTEVLKKQTAGCLRIVVAVAAGFVPSTKN